MEERALEEEEIWKEAVNATALFEAAASSEMASETNSLETASLP